MELPSNIFITDRYAVLEILGQGSMGQVLKCKDNKLGRIVAVKRILKDLDNESITRFHHEAKVTSQLEHENILKIYDFGQADDGQMFMVMDYLDGTSLRDLINNVGSLGFKDAYPIFLQICDGLSYAHSKGVLHRDIKPSNVILLERANDIHRVKLVDFGLAKATRSMDPKITKTGLAVGSPAYMSPEQSLGKEIDLRSDIYNFGCTLFQTLTGKTVFGSENPTEILNRQVRDKPPKLAETIDKEFDPKVESLVAKCLRKNPDNRFSNIEELKSALTDAIDSLDIEHESESSINQAIYDKSRLYYRILAVSMVTVFLIGMGYFMYAYLTRKAPSSAKKETKISHHIDTVTDTTTPISLGEAITSSYGFKVRKNPEGIEYIDASGQVEDKDLKEASKQFANSNIGLWNITHCHEFSGSGFKYIENLPVKELRLTKSRIDDQGCKSISNLSSLEGLAINRCVLITPRGIAYLSKLPKLRTLHISGRKLTTKDAFKQIAKLKNLKHLRISQVKLKGDALAPLIPVSNLKRISLDRCTVTKQAFGNIAKIKTMRALSLLETKFSSEGIARLKNSKIEDIIIAKWLMDESVIESLGDMKALRLLNFKGTNVGESSVRILNKLNPKCEVFVD